MAANFLDAKNISHMFNNLEINKDKPKAFFDYHWDDETTLVRECLNKLKQAKIIHSFNAKPFGLSYSSP